MIGADCELVIIGVVHLGMKGNEGAEGKYLEGPVNGEM
jgi:hypothetical protein